MFALTSAPGAATRRTSSQRHSVIATLLCAASLWRSRRALAALSATQLEDIGLSIEDARAEAARPIWDAPAHWYR